MTNYTEGRDDAKYIISALRDHLDYSLGETMLGLMQQIENYCEQAEQYHSNECCKELLRLAEDADVQAVSNIDPAYAKGVAHLFQGAVFLSQNNSNEGESQASLQSAHKSFARSLEFFREAGVSHGEAVALLARGIVYRRQYECSLDFSADHHWSEALKALQRSLTIFGDLGDSRQYRVRVMLAELNELFAKDREDRRKLEKKNPRVAAGIKTTHLTDYRQGKEIPVFGRIAAGEPILAEEDRKDVILVDEEIAGHANFALEVTGDSMEGAGILEGDIVLIERREDRPDDRQVVAAYIEQTDLEATLKRFRVQTNHIRLEPENDSYPLIIGKPDNVSEDDIRATCNKTHPKQLLEFHPQADVRIAGWARALIRKEIK